MKRGRAPGAVRAVLLMLAAVVIVALLPAVSAWAARAGGPAGHFANERLSFNYPPHWRPLSSFGPAQKYGYDREFDAMELAGVADPRSLTLLEKYTTWVVIEAKPRAPREGEQTLQQELDRRYGKYRVLSTRTLTVDGVTAYEKIYQRPHGEAWQQLRDIWLQKGNTLYVISCRALPERFAAVQADFNRIIGSFHVKPR
jgi:hypothetical protein